MAGKLGQRMRTSLPEVVGGQPTPRYWDLQRARAIETQEALESTVVDSDRTFNGAVTFTLTPKLPPATYTLGTHLGQPGNLPGAVRGGGNSGEYIEATANQDWVWDLPIANGLTLLAVSIIGEVAVATAFVASAFSYNPATGVVVGISAGISSPAAAGIYTVSIPLNIPPPVVTAPLLYSLRWRSVVTGNRARACIFTVQ